MARGRHTAQEYAQMLIARIEKYYEVEVKESTDDEVHFEIKGNPYSRSEGPMGIHRGRFGADVRWDGGVQVFYELFIPQDAQGSYELMRLLNLFNSSAGVTYWLENDPWKGAKLYARQELHIDRLEGAFAGKAANRILMAASDVANGLWELMGAMPQYFSVEELDRAAAEANLSPEELRSLPAECEAPPVQEEEAFFDESCFDEPEEGDMPRWCEEWGDEQAFLEKFINAPVEQMSGSELIMLNIALERNICRSRMSFLQAVDRTRRQDEENG